jgi:alpha-mannosidase
MSLRSSLLVACCQLSTIGAACADEPPPRASQKPTLWVIPHTHWEGAVFKTREEYLEDGLPNIVKALKLLREQPGYRFTLDQVAYVRPFLERYPALEPDFRRFLAEGRLQLVGALDVMPDDNMPGGETFIRQMQYGKGYYRERLGVDVTSGWLIDSFGHHAQLPQLLTKAGFKTFWFVRGVPRQDFPSEFFWEGIDGTRISSIYLPHSYALLYGSPNDKAGFKAFAQARFDMLSPNSHGPDRVGLSGPDVVEPEEQLAPRVEEFNRDPKSPFAMRMAVPADFEAAIAGRTDRPVWKGELNPIFQGIYSSRIELKGWMRLMEQELLTAEKLSAIGAWLGMPADLDGIWAGWEPVLFNQTHDLASGVMTDHVYEDTIRSYEFARRRAEALIDARWDFMTSKIDTRGPGSAVVVFNALGWTRSDIAVAAVGFDSAGVAAVSVKATDGQTVPSQILESTRYADGGLKTARVAFIARDVPAMGYAAYHLLPATGAAVVATPATSTAGPSVSFENELYRVTLDGASGAITSVRVKNGDWEALASAANIVAREQDRGDLWELYKGLDGASRVAMTTQQKVPKRGQAAFSDEGKGNNGTVTAGPVFSELRVARPFGTGKFGTTVRVYASLRRIEIKTSLVNHEKFVRYQALFPTVFPKGRSTHEIPFGAIDRPGSIEFPAQNWVDHGDGRRGLALLNIGLPGHVVTDGTMMVSLLRAHTLGAYGFGGGYEPGMSSESGYQLGQERTMQYALVPHAGDWREAGLVRDGLELNHPLICRPVLSHSGKLPARWAFLDVSNPHVVTTAMKPCRDGEIALRFYESSGRPAPGVSIMLPAKLSSAREANLLEDPGAAVKTDGNTVRLDFTPFEIKTIRLKMDAFP